MDFLTLAALLPLHEQMCAVEETVRFGGWESDKGNE